MSKTSLGIVMMVIFVAIVVSLPRRGEVKKDVVNITTKDQHNRGPKQKTTVVNDSLTIESFYEKNGYLKKIDTIINKEVKSTSEYSWGVLRHYHERSGYDISFWRNSNPRLVYKKDTFMSYDPNKVLLKKITPKKYTEYKDSIKILEKTLKGDSLSFYKNYKIIDLKEGQYDIKKWDDNGKLVSFCKFLPNGKRFIKKYYPNGVIKEKGYVNERLQPHGWYSFYNKNGVRIKHDLFKDGEVYTIDEQIIDDIINNPKKWKIYDVKKFHNKWNYLNLDQERGVEKGVTFFVRKEKIRLKISWRSSFEEHFIKMKNGEYYKKFETVRDESFYKIKILSLGRTMSEELENSIIDVFHIFNDRYEKELEMKKEKRMKREMERKKKEEERMKRKKMKEERKRKEREERFKKTARKILGGNNI